MLTHRPAGPGAGPGTRLEAERADLEALLAAAPEPLELAALLWEIYVLVGDLRSVLADGRGL